MLRRMGQGIGLLLAAGAVALVVLYVARPAGSKRAAAPPAEANAAATLVAATRYAPVTPLPVTPVRVAPTPMPPRIVDVTSGAVTPLDLPSDNGLDYTVQALFADGHIFAESTRHGGIFDREGRPLAGLPTLFGTEIFSRDRRYMAYTAGGMLQLSDSSGHVGRTIPPDVAFDTGFGDGWLLLPGNGSVAPGYGAAIIEPDGQPAQTFGLETPARLGVDSISPDPLRVAWAAPDGLHIFSVAGRSERVYRDVAFVAADIAWSPDGRRIAYARVTGDNSVHIWIIDLDSGAQHEVYAGAPEEGVVDLAFLSTHELSFRVSRISERGLDVASLEHFRVGDDGSGLEAFETPADHWHRCGPACGMPPPDDEDGDGIARWCVGDTICDMHAGYVDRARGRVVALDPGETAYEIAVSPDRKIIAVLAGAADGDEVRLVPLDGGATRTIPLPGDFDSSLAWFPDGGSLLIFSQGRN